MSRWFQIVENVKSCGDHTNWLNLLRSFHFKFVTYAFYWNFRVSWNSEWFSECSFQLQKAMDALKLSKVFWSCRELMNVSILFKTIDWDWTKNLMSSAEICISSKITSDNWWRRSTLCFCQPPWLLVESLFRGVRYCDQLFRLSIFESCYESFQKNWNISSFQNY